VNAAQPFRLWAFGEAHVGTDVRRGPDGRLHEHYHRPFEQGTPFTCGSPGIPTPTPTTITAARPTSSGVGVPEFLNVASLSRYHMPITTLPVSRVLTFTPGGDEVRVQCYLHTGQYAAQGWYEKAERTIGVGRPFVTG
jgi:hypothetical protein